MEALSSCCFLYEPQLQECPHMCFPMCICVPDNATAAGCSPWGGSAVNTYQYICLVCVGVCVCVKWWWNVGRVLQWAAPHRLEKTRRTSCLYDKRRTHRDPNCHLSPAGWENRLPKGIDTPPLQVSSHRPLFCHSSFFFHPALLHTLLNFISSSCPLLVSLLRSSGFCFICASSCLSALCGGIFVAELLLKLKRMQAEDERSSQWEDAQFLNCSQVKGKKRARQTEWQSCPVDSCCSRWQTFAKRRRGSKVRKLLEYILVSSTLLSSYVLPHGHKTTVKTVKPALLSNNH